MKKAKIIENGNVNLKNIVVKEKNQLPIKLDLSKINVLLDKRNTRLPTAIKLIQKHFSPEVLSDQMGEDYSIFQELISEE